MAPKKIAKGDLNAPLRSLSERLRSLQREANQLLESTRRSDSRRGAGDGAKRSAADAQMGRVAANFLERWEIPTRADIDEIHRRLDRIEEAILALRPAAPVAKPRRPAKTRRGRGGAPT